MRILVYGLQNSGASTITVAIGRRRECICIPDLYSWYLPPAALANHHDVILKCVINTRHSWHKIVEVFKPDITVLVYRSPISNYLSLANKSYANELGSIREKFEIANSCLHGQFDYKIRYEDFLADGEDSQIAIKKMESQKVERSIGEILSYNFKANSWCLETYQREWAFGEYKEVPEWIKSINLEQIRMRNGL